jgi:hypothetical protein
LPRINLYKKYPESLKLVHLLPMVFTVGMIFLILLSLILWSWIPLSLILLYALIIFLDSSLQSKSLKIGALSIISAFIQLMGYGCGFLQAWWRRCVRGKDEFSAYEKTFYK